MLEWFKALPMTAKAIGGLLALGLAVWLGLTAKQHYQQGRGAKAEQQSQQFHQEAEHHAGAAEAIPDHSQALAGAQADVDRARAEVARLKRILATKPSIPVPDPVSPDPSDLPPVAIDQRDSVIASQDVLIESQDKQIGALKLALADEQNRSGEWKSAFENERKATAAQAVATKAWKDAVTTSRWRGRIEGFAVGVALGYFRGNR